MEFLWQGTSIEATSQFVSSCPTVQAKDRLAGFSPPIVRAVAMFIRWMGVLEFRVAISIAWKTGNIQVLELSHRRDNGSLWRHNDFGWRCPWPSTCVFIIICQPTFDALIPPVSLLGTGSAILKWLASEIRPQVCMWQASYLDGHGDYRLHVVLFPLKLSRCHQPRRFRRVKSFPARFRDVL
jgi:hypothetical protein